MSDLPSQEACRKAVDRHDAIVEAGYGAFTGPGSHAISFSVHKFVSKLQERGYEVRKT